MKSTGGGEVSDPTVLLHALEVHQAELELQNHELLVANDDLRHSNHALALARDRYRALYELAPTPLVTVDVRGNLIDVNGAAETLLGGPRTSLTGRAFGLFVAEAQRVRVRGLLRDLFEGVRQRGVELVMASDVEVLVDAVAIRDDETGARRAVLALVDVTARNRADGERRDRERRAEEAQRLESLGVLAGGIAHDFNNLLTVVLGGAEVVLRAIDAQSPSARTLNEVIQAAQHAGELAHQMLAYSGKATTPKRALQLSRVIREIEPLLRAATKTIPLAIEVPDALPPVVGDEVQLRQLVLNLVINAAEAMQARGGAITIAASAADQRVVLEVRDDGVGMDEATRERIFEPYFSTKFTGRGLGLSVVQGIVRGHGGTLTVRSAPGRGTTFCIELPASSAVAPARRPAAIERTVHPAAGASLLLVDDDPLVRLAISRMLKSLGFAVIVASDGLEAIDVFRAESEHVDLVLMDLTMPRMDGVAAARAIHLVRHDVPIVLITGYGDIPADADGVFAGVLAKPIELAQLRALIASLLPGAQHVTT